VRNKKVKPWGNGCKVCVLNICSQIHAENPEVALEGITKPTLEVPVASNTIISIDQMRRKICDPEECIEQHVHRAR
jgi:hypothetical protein